MDDLRYANIALDLFCIVLSILPIVYLISNHRYRQRLNLFFWRLHIQYFYDCRRSSGLIFSDSGCCLGKKMILSIATTLYYAASAFVLYFFIQYIMEYLMVTGRAKKFCSSYALALCSVQAVFAVISPFTGFIFPHNR